VAELAASATELTRQAAELPATARVRALAELGGALHEAVAGPLVLAVAEAAEEGLGIDEIRAAAGPGYPFVRSALGLVR
jgi:hypothetical protein